MLMPFGDRPERQPRLEPLRYAVPERTASLYALSSYLASTVTPGDACLLWITAFGVWPSSENMHLYYRLRESYGEHRLLHEAPAQLCLKHEHEDLATSIWLALLFGWDAYVLPDSDHLAVYFSHDELLEMYSRSAAQRVELETRLAQLQIKPLT